MTRLDRVTITGADDSVSADELYRLSEQYPFVEWGILFSGKHQGSRRYPSEAWLATLAETKPADVKIAAHLCGRWVRSTLAGQADWWRAYPKLASQFGRIQLNFHAEAVDPMTLGTFVRELAASSEFIYQCDGVNDGWVRELIAEVKRGSPLFDTSGGAGIEPESWPKGWEGVYCGYAGGIGPENCVEVLGPIVAAAWPGIPFWIDMERKVRSEDDATFDLDKVRTVLDRVAMFAGVQT